MWLMCRVLVCWCEATCVLLLGVATDAFFNKLYCASACSVFGCCSAVGFFHATNNYFSVFGFRFFPVSGQIRFLQTPMADVP